MRSVLQDFKAVSLEPQSFDSSHVSVILTMVMGGRALTFAFSGDQVQVIAAWASISANSSCPWTGLET